jgi:two-component system CheB/CheR fusion protein
VFVVEKLGGPGGRFWRRAGLAVAAVAVGVLIRRLLDPVLADYGNYAFLMIAVVVSAWYGGWGSGLLAIGLALIAGDYFWGEPRYTLALTTAQEQLRAGSFVIFSLLVCKACERVRQMRVRGASAEREREEIRLRARAAEAALAASEREFRTMFELAGVGQAGADPHTGRFHRVNRRLCEITGYSEAELLQLTYRELTHPEDRERDADTIRAAFEGSSNNWTSEKRYLRKDGEIIWVEVTGAVVRHADGSLQHSVAVIQDITARKQAEAVVRAREEQLRLMADSIPAMISFVDAEERYRFVNRRYEAWFAQPREQIQGLTMRELLGEVAYAGAQPHIATVLSGREATYESWIDFVGSGRRCVYEQYVPDRDEQGEVRGFFVLVQDITEQKRIEESLREADRRKDEFLAMLAHELRNPLAPVLTAVQVLEQRASADPDPVAARQRAVIDRQSRHMARLLDDLLDVSRITRGKTELRKQALDLTALLYAVAESSQAIVQEYGHELTVNLPPTAVPVVADAARLHQVVGNLLTNAAKYTPPGGKLFLSLEVGASAVIHVRDNGMGIAPEFLPHVFDLFAQGEHSLSRTTGGLGVGLTLVKSLVEMHDGDVDARSAGLGRGSEFIVRLPLEIGTSVSEPTPPAVSRTGPVTGEPRRIVVVDDNRDAAETLAELLSLWGWDARVAIEGVSGLALVEAFRPAVVILDIGMPGRDGYQVAQELRKRERAGDHTLRSVIALTGFGQREDRERAFAAGFDHHLTKPVDPERLRELLGALFPATG